MRALSFALVTGLLSALAIGCGSPCADLDLQCEKCSTGRQVSDCKYCVRYYSGQACEKFLQETGDCPIPVLLGCDQLGSSGGGN